MANENLTNKELWQDVTSKESYVLNCFLKPRDPDAIMFESKDGVLMAKLQGYAIVPAEEYLSLTEQS